MATRVSVKVTRCQLTLERVTKSELGMGVIFALEKSKEKAITNWRGNKQLVKSTPGVTFLIKLFSKAISLPQNKQTHNRGVHGSERRGKQDETGCNSIIVLSIYF